jgi:hypothetical protein
LYTVTQFSNCEQSTYTDIAVLGTLSLSVKEVKEALPVHVLQPSLAELRPVGAAVRGAVVCRASGLLLLAQDTSHKLGRLEPATRL